MENRVIKGPIRPNTNFNYQKMRFFLALIVQLLYYRHLRDQDQKQYAVI